MVRRTLLVVALLCLPHSAGAQGVRDSLPPGVTPDMIERGNALFHGRGMCVNCHGADATGMLGPDLTDGEWVQSSGDVAGIAQTITNGVSEDTMKGEFPRAMGAFGRRLQPGQIEALAQYVLSLQN